MCCLCNCDFIVFSYTVAQLKCIHWTPGSVNRYTEHKSHWRMLIRPRGEIWNNNSFRAQSESAVLSMWARRKGVTWTEVEGKKIKHSRHIAVGKYGRKAKAAPRPIFSSQTTSPGGLGAPWSSCRDTRRQILKGNKAGSGATASSMKEAGPWMY